MASVSNLFTCPHCSRAIHFDSEIVNHMFCTCGNAVYLNGEGGIELKYIPAITVANDLIQPGTEGAWRGRKFIVTGRFRTWFNENVFNYWTLDFNDGKLYYLGEGYGLYGIYETLPNKYEVLSRELEVFSLDRKLSIAGLGEFRLLRKDDIRYWDAEGSFFLQDSKAPRVYEAMAEDAGVINIFESEKNVTQIFSVLPIEFDELQFSKLREVRQAGKVFVCTECNHENTVANYPYAQSWTCSNCTSMFHLVGATQVKRIGKPLRGTAPHIPLGQELILNNTTYTVVGFAWKEDTSGQTGSWKEYSLFNDKKGYAFLNESEGHWMLMKEQIGGLNIEPAHQAFYCLGKKFRLFSKYSYHILYAEGVFPGNVFNDSHTSYAYDYICPPEIWSLERNKDEGLTWFYGTYINPKELRKQGDFSLPQKSGVGMLQPGGSVDIPLLIKTTFALLIIAIAIHIFIGARTAEKVLINQSFSMSSSESSHTFVTNKFTLNKWKSNLEFEVYAPVDNSWFEVSASLVNAKTGDEYGIQQGVEYYHGYEGGENWTEGDQHETAYLNSIPAGTYFLRIEGQRDATVASYNGVSDFSVKVTYDVPMFRNLMITILILLIYPVIVVWVSNNTERNRWYGSPYSKFTYEN
jgi:hypothetical protein